MTTSYPEPELLALIAQVEALTGAKITQNDAAAFLDELKAKHS